MALQEDGQSRRSNLSDFGYQKVRPDEKKRLVDDVFHRVSPRYDIMNDLMSLGMHRFWKSFAVDEAYLKPEDRVLDVACGSCDLTALMAKKLSKDGLLCALDYNASMLHLGRDKMLNAGVDYPLSYIQASAESLPFEDHTFDLVTIAFGLRNVTDKLDFLSEAFRVLSPSGRLMILEFSKPRHGLLSACYDQYLLKVIPCMGSWVSGDAESYRYLAESIKMHPDQETLRDMCASVGFERCRVQNLISGIVAIHSGMKVGY